MLGLPGGGRVLSLAVDPVTPATLYAGHQFGMFKTTTGGTSWSPINTGLPGGGQWLDRHGRPPPRAGDSVPGLDRGMFKTIDGGASWNPGSAGLPALPVQSLAIDPTAAGTVYAGPADAAAPTSPEFPVSGPGLYGAGRRGDELDAEQRRALRNVRHGAPRRSWGAHHALRRHVRRRGLQERRRRGELDADQRGADQRRDLGDGHRPRGPEHALRSDSKPIRRRRRRLQERRRGVRAGVR